MLLREYPWFKQGSFTAPLFAVLAAGTAEVVAVVLVAAVAVEEGGAAMASALFSCSLPCSAPKPRYE